MGEREQTWLTSIAQDGGRRLGIVLYTTTRRRARQSTGHAPGKRSWRGPFEMRAVRWNVADIVECGTSLVMTNVHGGHLVGVPGLIENVERPPRAGAGRR